jgi:putative ABC transport system permease protein
MPLPLPEQKAKGANIWTVARKLAFRQVQRSNKWMTALIVAIMTLTFLNLVVITGILVGLTEGLFTDYEDQFTKDVIISTLMGEDAIENTQSVLQTLENHPSVQQYSVRYIQSATVEANYQTRWDFESPENSVSTQLTGINPDAEDAVTHLSQKVVEGQYLNQGESGYVLMGALMLDEYATFSDTFDPLVNVKPGTRVKLSFVAGQSSDNEAQSGHGGSIESGSVDRTNSVSAEFIVKGILDSKVGQVASRAYITDQDWNRLVNQKLDYADEIAIELVSGVSDIQFVKELQGYGFGKYAQIETSAQAVPSTLNDLQKTFRLLGNLMGGIAVIVSSITVFVVIYVNALTRRKHIGVLKGIGINGKSIERAYVMQSLFYAIVGITIGFAVIFIFLVPFFQKHPIDFPVSDGILAVTINGTLFRALVLLVITAIAGFLPAWLVVRGNTLDSILGR